MLTVSLKGGGDRQLKQGLEWKYQSNYYYAPPMPESAGPHLREPLEKAGSAARTRARGNVDYTHTRGWDEVNQASNENELRNVEQSTQAQTWSGVGGQGIAGGQQPWQTGTTKEQAGQYGWTGTQAGEGQPGMGGSSLAQGGQWVGQPVGQPVYASGMGPQQGVSGQGFGAGFGQGFGPQGYAQYGGTLPPWAYGTPREVQAGYGQPGYGQGLQAGFGGQTGWSGQRWTGTQAGEGQPGMGPSSLAQGPRWIGQSSFGGVGPQNLGAQGYGQFTGALPPWTRHPMSQEESLAAGMQGVRWPAQPWVGTGWGGPGFGGGVSGGNLGWTGTQYGEGPPGMGPSSLAQGPRWIGQSSLSGGFMGQQGMGPGYGTQWTGTQYGEGRPGMGPSSVAQGARWAGEPSWIPQGIQRGSQGSQGV